VLAPPASASARQRLMPREHRAIAILTPVITPEWAVLGAGRCGREEQSQRIGTDGPAHRPGAARHAKARASARVSAVGPAEQMLEARLQP